HLPSPPRMLLMLVVGSQVLLDDGAAVTVRALIGEGSEGAVFAVDDVHGRPFALKWYKGYDASRITLLSNLIRLRSPGGRFVWPLALARTRHDQVLGYVMYRCPTQFLELGKYAGGYREAEPVAVVRCCLQLARSFQRLHARGLCYRDISLRNVLFDPHTGDI